MIYRWSHGFRLLFWILDNLVHFVWCLIVRLAGKFSKHIQVWFIFAKLLYAFIQIITVIPMHFKKTVLITSILTSILTSPVIYADPPNKAQLEADKEHMKYQREAQKKRQEYEREQLKAGQEADREAKKHYEEMWREESKHAEEMDRERRKHWEEMSK